jgi:hypothetical protein
MEELLLELEEYLNQWFFLFIEIAIPNIGEKYTRDMSYLLYFLCIVLKYFGLMPSV